MPREYNRIPRTCNQCGISFDVYPSVIAKGGGQYCSSKCFGIVKSARISRKCKTCNKAMVLKPASPIKFCSRACSVIANTMRRPRLCKVCGAGFETIPTRIDRGLGLYCSRQCGWVAKRRDIEERFWPLVQKGNAPDDCWIWTGTLNAYGYGVIGSIGRQMKAHRLSYEMASGPIPEGLLVLHSCPGGDNPKCVNPRHLRCGTIADNNRDREERTPVGKGAQSPSAKVTLAQCQELYELVVVQGWSRLAAADHGGVSRSLIDTIVTGRHWSRKGQVA